MLMRNKQYDYLQKNNDDKLIIQWVTVRGKKTLMF